MSSNGHSNSAGGLVASLHLHPEQRGAAFSTVEEIEVAEGLGIKDNPRYFARTSRSGGYSKRQVSLIEREQIAEHAVVLGLKSIPPGVVRANIETSGINLIALIGQQVQIGEAILFFYEGRTPCEKMDLICPGLRDLMSNNRQGVMAQVIRPGRIRVGDSISTVIR